MNSLLLAAFIVSWVPPATFVNGEPISDIEAFNIYKDEQLINSALPNEISKELDITEGAGCISMTTVARGMESAPSTPACFDYGFIPGPVDVKIEIKFIIP